MNLSTTAIAGQPPILARLNGVTATDSNNWQALCPAHNDTRPSLSISIGSDGRTLVHCHVGCTAQEVVEAVDMTLRDLFPVGGNGRARRGHVGNGQSQIGDPYGYTDERAELLYQKIRLDPKGFRLRSPEPGGGWRNSVAGVRKVLYHLPELAAAPAGTSIFFCEGEKDCDRLRIEIMLATGVPIGSMLATTSGGVGQWDADFPRFFAGHHVAILADNDAAGRKHAHRIARELHGTAAAVHVVELPDLPEKGDVSDWLDNGHTIQELWLFVGTVPVWQPSDAPAIVPEPAASEFHLTDSGNAERFAAMHGDTVRYCFPWHKWLVWDSTRWRLDDAGAVDQLCKATARSILQEASEETNDSRRRTLTQFAVRSEAAPKLAAMLSRGRSEPGIPILPDELDNDPWLLNCRNGTLELRTGTLREHRRGDYLTKLCPLDYRPEIEVALI